MKYNWQLENWPNFQYSIENIQSELLEYATQNGKLLGKLSAMPHDQQDEAIIKVMTAEAMKSSEIEGEFLSRVDVMSSIQRGLGIGNTDQKVADKRSEGMANMLVEVRKSYHEDLSETVLFNWHQLLLSHQSSEIEVGKWRTFTEPMQVVSNIYNKPKVHFEAPPAVKVPGEMKQFIQWFNNSFPDSSTPITNAPVRSAIAHLYFESIHPFEDGNGRIGRAIAEKALLQSVKASSMVTSLSLAIEANKKHYYSELEKAQKSKDVTEWVEYFVHMVLEAQKDTEKLICFIIEKSQFFDRYKEHLNKRQFKVIRRMFKEGPEGFEGGMNAKKYMSITSCSKATATRDLSDLYSQGALVRMEQGGRSTHYELNINGVR